MSCAIATSAVAGLGRGVVLAACAFLLAPLSAQDRRPVLGSVLDRDGKAVAGAEVTLYWTPPGEASADHNDQITATTDERGRFVARVLPQIGYSAFAVGKAVADGARPVSSVRDGVAAGSTLELRLDQVAHEFPVELRGADAWRDVGPLQVQLVPIAANVILLPGVRIGDRLRLPPGPPFAWLLVQDARGLPLFAGDAALEYDQPVVTAELPAPREVRVHVVDEHGGPVAGVELGEPLFSAAIPRWFGLMRGQPCMAYRPLGRTDGAGDLLCRVFTPRDTLLQLIASKAGFASTVVGDKGSAPAGPRSDTPDAITLLLHKAQEHRLRIGGTPLEHHGLALCGWVLGDDDSKTSRLTRVTSDGEGRAAWPPPPEWDDALVVLDPLRAADGATSVVLRLPDLAYRAELEITSLRKVTVQIQNAEHDPLSGVCVAAVPRPANLDFVCAPMFTDHAGRAMFRLGHGEWFLFATNGKGVAWQLLREADRQPESSWQLQLRPLAQARLKVVDREGKPLAGAVAREIRAEKKAARENDQEAQMLDELGGVLCDNLRFQGLESDVDGLLSVPLFHPEDRRYTCTICFGKRSTEVQLEAGTETVDIVVR